MRKVMVVTRAEMMIRAEVMRRRRYEHYSTAGAAGGKASRKSPKAHCLSDADRRRAAVRRRLNNLLKRDIG